MARASTIEDDLRRTFRLIDERIAEAADPGPLSAFRRRLVGELVNDADAVASTLAPGFELVTRAGGATTVTGREAMVEGLRGQGAAGGAVMWVELDDLVVDGGLAGHGVLRTLLTPAAAAARGLPGSDDPSLTSFPFAFFVRFDGDRMASEVLYMDAAATEVTVLPGARLPTAERLLELVDPVPAGGTGELAPGELAPGELNRGVYLPDLLVAALRRDPRRPAVSVGGEVLTAAELADRTSRYAQAYEAQGVTPGSGVAMLSVNRPEVLFAMGAYMTVGARNTPLHPLGSLSDHAYVLEDAGIETLVFDPSFAGRVAELRDRVPGLKRLLSFGPCDVGVDLIELAEGYPARPLRAPAVDGEAAAALAYTGGTTGSPKGVVTAYRGSAAMVAIMMAEWQWPEPLRHLICTPLSHAGASFFVPVLLRGGSLVVIPKFDAGTVLRTIERDRITSVFLVPSMLYALLDHPDFAGTDLSSLQTVFYGAAPVSPTRLREAIERLGPIFFQFYGQTEAPQTVFVLRKEEHDVTDPARLASCGRPVPWVHVALLDQDGNEVPRGEAGEVCVRGPLVMKGYWNKPAETAAALAGGWLHTGDVARRDDSGFYTIVDRTKDMIVSGGFNVFPREVEDVLSTHPSVAAAAVIGVPDEKWGEAVKAVVVLRDGAAVPAGELMALVKERKGAHYAPKSVDVVDAIPLTAVGKPDKKALRARYWSGSDRQVG